MDDVFLVIVRPFFGGGGKGAQFMVHWESVTTVHLWWVGGWGTRVVDGGFPRTSPLPNSPTPQPPPFDSGP